MNVVIPIIVAPRLIAALDLAASELRKQYGKAEDDRPLQLPENVGCLTSLRDWIAEALADAEKAA